MVIDAIKAETTTMKALPGSPFEVVEPKLLF
jgi:hypothetical protein